jgi:hypothetical protein
MLSKPWLVIHKKSLAVKAAGTALTMAVSWSTRDSEPGVHLDSHTEQSAYELTKFTTKLSSRAVG